MTGPEPVAETAERDPELLAAIDKAAAEMVRRLFDPTSDEPVRDLRTALAEGLYDALLASLAVKDGGLLQDSRRRSQVIAAAVAERDSLRAQVAAVRALAEQAANASPPVRRWVGWSVGAPDRSSSFGTFTRREAAELCLADVQRSLAPDAVIVERYVQDPADTSLHAHAVLAALDAATADGGTL